MAHSTAVFGGIFIITAASLFTVTDVKAAESPTTERRAKETETTETSANRFADTIETVTITATRIGRDVKDVPESISVIDGERIAQARMFNIADAIAGTPGVNITSKSGGYDTRLIIRGGGLKANYGIREIFMMRDGVPITDPDSFSKLDFIDTQDIERIEITKGPGNIYATGSTAGVVHIISRSVFEESDNYIGVAAGDNGRENISLRFAAQSGNRGYALTASQRKDNNDWRINNAFESNQVSFKFGQRWANQRELLVELGYTDADLQLPGDMTETQFQHYLSRGEQTDSNSQFKHRGRYSNTFTANMRYRMPLNDNWQFNPKVYYTHWQQFHPVVPLITTAAGVDVIGSDLEFTREQRFGELVAGLTYRQETSNGNKKYQYGDVTTNATGRIVATNSDSKGPLAEQSDSENTVAGVFAQQSITLFENWIIDASMRYDRICVDQIVERYREFNWGRGVYQNVDESEAQQRLNQHFTLLSKRLGVSYSVSDEWSLFGNIASGEQVPFASELEDNPTLQESRVNSVELGVKGRSNRWQVDISTYAMAVEDEIISILDANGETEFQNAGKTDKVGVELAYSVVLFETAELGSLSLGANYTYSDYTFAEFYEIITRYGPSGATTSEADRGGNQLPFIPEHYTSVSLNYRHMNGLTVRLQSDNWNQYFVDNANSETDNGYTGLVSLNLGYDLKQHHKISFNIANITNKRYASVVKKDVGSEKVYTPGAPRSWLLSYRYSF